jgi:hypothetical protein
MTACSGEGKPCTHKVWFLFGLAPPGGPGFREPRPRLVSRSLLAKAGRGHPASIPGAELNAHDHRHAHGGDHGHHDDAGQYHHGGGWVAMDEVSSGLNHVRE